ncbi:MAG: DUF3365 domain-containing protein [Bacteroidetes bacterium]|nr:DUF3365 domain-containing protein [Bacteroidota bacterium]
MKKYLFIFLLVFISILFDSCNKIRLKIINPTEEEAMLIIATGDSVAKALNNALKRELKAAIESGGFPNAIAVCNKIAQQVTDSITLNSGQRVKRTTIKYRNEANAPDTLEKIALDHFETLFADKKELPEFYTQKITERGESFFRFYKPVKVEQLCLGCHGKPENMDTITINRLTNLYPDDMAMGYSEGDFRGVISVTIRK